MPHLSPMNWLMSLMMLWTILLLVSTSFWWSQPNTFLTHKISNSNINKNIWQWSL